MQVDSCCFLRVSWTKPSLQCWHLYGLSPVWILSWACILAFCTKPLPQNLHLCSFKSIWIFSCLRREPWKKRKERAWGLWNWISCLSKYVLPEVGYSLLQNLQGSPLNSEWVLTWAGKFLFRTFLLHTSHSTSYKRRVENESSNNKFLKQPILGNKN